MSPNKKLRRLLLPIGAAALVAGGMAVIGAAPSTAATQNTAAATARTAKSETSRTVTLNLVDRLTKWYPSETASPTDPPIGYMTVWFGSIQNADDAAQAPAPASGNLAIVGKDASTGATTAHMSELIQFSDGAIRYDGLYNRTDAIAQKWITVRAVGVSGRYAGLSGTVHWRITSITDPAIPVEEHVVLLGHRPLL